MPSLRAALATLLTALIACCAVAAPTSALVPEAAVGGTQSRWFSGSLIQQTGQNCSILGAPYSEVMVSGIGSYGGRNGVVKVGDEYWTAVLLSVPGNPCGLGSAGIATDLLLPHGTAIDTTRQIRCFYLSRNATRVDQFSEVTGQTWSAFGSSGQICPAQASPSMYHSGGYSIGFRPLVNGSQLQVFVPVKSTRKLLGMAGPDRFMWMTNSVGVYANPGGSEVWANVFENLGEQPYVYFAREQSAVPFWKADAPQSPLDLRNRTEFFANFYVAGKAGRVSFEIRRTDTPSPTLVIDSSSPAAGFDGTVGAGQELIQILPGPDVTGPGGGWAPFAWDKPGQNGNVRGEWNTPMTIRWTFTPQTGPAVHGTQSFRTLAGPDSDGDGVADVADACPALRGTTADGCLPVAPPDPDGDGFFGDLDRCPAAPAPGSLDGCPAGGGGGGEQPPPGGGGGGGTPPPGGGGESGGTPPGGGGGATPPPVARPAAAQLVVTVRAKRGARFTAAALRRGARVRFACSHASSATVALTVAGRAARALGLRGRAPALARATVRCGAGRDATVTLKPARAVAARLASVRRPLPATLTVALRAPGATAGGASVAVKVG
ncbi:MAG TPA: hypothetical protein VLK58_01285 [Conexibacter sp.]|nr:hypothetical protein [Conexibacter sp.]